MFHNTTKIRLQHIDTLGNGIVESSLLCVWFTAGLGGEAKGSAASGS